MNIKKITAIILSLCFILSPAFSASASLNPPDTLMPMYNNTDGATISASVDESDGYIRISYNLTGVPGITTKIVAVTYLEKQSFGFIWTKVDNGQPNKEWVDEINGYTYPGVRYFHLPSTGTYRVTVEYTVYGNGGSPDVIECQRTVTY